MSYNFTTLFENYKNSSYAQTTWDDNEYDLSRLTIDEYLDFRNDNSSKFHALVDSFSKYIKSDNTIAGIDLASINNQAKATGVEVGSYLILPSNLVSHESASSFGNFVIDAYSIYDALIANAVFSTLNGSWSLDVCNVTSKGYSRELSIETYLVKSKTADLLSMEGTMASVNKEMQFNTDYSFVMMISDTDKMFISKARAKVTIKFPSGLDYNVNDILMVNGDNGICTISDGKIYAGQDAIANISFDDDNRTLIIDSITSNFDDWLIFGIGISLNENTVLGISGNRIETIYEFSPDQYDQSVRKTLTLENNATTYGLQITNKYQNNGNVNLLENAIFGIYTDEKCTDKVAEITTGSNGVGSIKGAITDNYYIKQIKATSGYKLNNNVFTAIITSENLNDSGYYSLEITNDKMGLLPSTGGLGTILYTLVGLLVIGVGSTMFIKYRQKQVQN